MVDVVVVVLQCCVGAGLGAWPGAEERRCTRPQAFCGRLCGIAGLWTSSSR